MDIFSCDFRPADLDYSRSISISRCLTILTRQDGLSTSAATESNGYPDTLDVGHLEMAIRVLTMLARAGCSSFDERLDLLMQVSAWLLAYQSRRGNAACKGVPFPHEKAATAHGRPQVAICHRALRSSTLFLSCNSRVEFIASLFRTRNTGKRFSMTLFQRFVAIQPPIMVGIARDHNQYLVIVFLHYSSSQSCHLTSKSVAKC